MRFWRNFRFLEELKGNCLKRNYRGNSKKSSMELRRNFPEIAGWNLKESLEVLQWSFWKNSLWKSGVRSKGLLDEIQWNFCGGSPEEFLEVIEKESWKSSGGIFAWTLKEFLKDRWRKSKGIPDEVPKDFSRFYGINLGGTLKEFPVELRRNLQQKF